MGIGCLRSESACSSSTCFTYRRKRLVAGVCVLRPRDRLRIDYRGGCGSGDEPQGAVVAGTLGGVDLEKVRACAQ